MRRLFAVLASLAVLAGLVAVASPAQAARTVAGTIYGSDGRAVDAFLGFDLKDSSNRTIDKNGCLATRCGLHGYGITLRLNGTLAATGSTNRTAYKTSWAITVPSNTAHMFIEVYPFSAGTYGHTDESRYGHAYRRNIAIPYPARINIRLPLICSQGGTTGAISGRATVGGAATTLKRVATWSLGTDNNGPSPILGWNVGTTSSGAFTLPNLPAGQKYQVLATAPSGAMKRYYGIAVNSCRTTALNIAF
jgi:hypothetical protein